MSQSAMQEITCPACGAVTPFLVWDSINTKENPEMKEKVRTGEAFQLRCPKCGASALLQYNFLYHQQEDHVLMYVGAEGSGDGEMASLFARNGNAFDGYTKRIVHSYNDFKEKLLILDAGLDDRIVEIIKSSVWDNVEARYKDQHIDEILFAMGEDDTPGFIFRSKGRMTASMPLDRALYKAIREVALSRIEALSRGDFVIDRKWAKAVIAKLG